MSSTSAVQNAYQTLRRAADAKPYLSIEAREDLLTRLEKMVVTHRDALVQANSEDFGFRGRMEASFSEVLIPADAARNARKNLRDWVSRRPVNAHPLFVPSYTYVEPMPLGVVGIMAPWNYPVMLALAPAAAAFAAGNRVLLKPSEATPKTSQLLAKLVSDVFSAEECAVVLGGPEVSKEVAALPLDHLLFTGSTQVGRHIARAAAENLTPVTLELGGKSPAVVHPSYSIVEAAERIAFGKGFNGGQSCTAPDYAVVPSAHAQRFVQALVASFVRQFPDGKDFTSMVHERALARMHALVDDAKAKGAVVAQTFTAPAGSRVFAPVVLLNVTDDMLVMQEEIFGPILPVETFDDFDAALGRIHARPRPLSFFYFDDDDARVDGVLRRVQSGGVCINDTLVHFAQEELPFGGLGPSGMGAHHGAAGFETFSHLRGVMVSSRMSPVYRLFRPPFSRLAKKTVDFLISGWKGLVSS